MTLLKNDGTTSAKKISKSAGLEVRDGWRFGIGFGSAMFIAVSLILLLLGCIIGVGVMVLGGSLGALM